MQAIAPSTHAAARTPATANTGTFECLAASVEHIHRTLAKRMHRFLMLLREFDLHHAYRALHVGGQPATDTAHWLESVRGVRRETVRENLRVAYLLLNLPEVDAAFAAGELSYEKVAALTTIATAENEAEFLDLARVMTEAQVADYCARGVRQISGRRPPRAFTRRGAGVPPSSRRTSR